MDRWSDFSNQIDTAFPAASPQAAQPGTGAGNRAYAPGVMSGQHGMTPEAGQMYRQMDTAQQGQRQGMQMGPAMASVGQAPPGGQAGQMQMTPMMQAQMLDYLMKMMQQRASTGQKNTVSTTGGF